MIVVDTSALMAILQEEPEAEHFFQVISRSQRALIAAPTGFEFYLVTIRQKGAAYLPLAEKVVAASPLEIAPWTESHIAIATQAFVRFGGSPARLNYGDCIAYAVAKALDAPLLFKGDDFRHTDVHAAA